MKGLNVFLAKVSLIVNSNEIFFFSQLKNQIMKVFLLKNENSPNDYYREILSRSFDPVFIPLLKHTLFIEPMIEFLNNQMHKYQIIIITSQRAVECLQQCIESTRLEENLKQKILDLPVYTIGPSTHEYLTNIGFKNVIGKDSGNGHKLSKVILEQVNDEAIIYFTGEIRKDIIPNNMKNNNKNYSEFPVYATRESEQIDIQQHLEHESGWIIFFSSQGTQKVLDYIKDKASKFKFGVIGPTTNEYLIKNGIKVDIVCESPTADSLYRQILEMEN